MAEDAHIVDRLAIHAVLIAYAEAIDSRDWESLKKCFTASGATDFGPYGGRNQGPDTIVATCRAGVGHLDATHHVITNLVIEFIDDDRAHVRSYLTAQHVRRGLTSGELFTVGGHYEDRVVRTDAGWQLESKVLRVTWTGGNSGVFADSPSVSI